MQYPRRKYSVGLAYATRKGRRSHVAAHDTMIASKDQYGFNEIAPFGILEPEKPTKFSPLKVRTFAYLSAWWSFFNAAGICDFVPVPRSSMPVNEVIDALSAFTGWKTSLFEAVKVGERALALARVFNAREGFGVEDDLLPERLHGPLKNGALKGNFLPKEDFKQALHLYYAMMGWDEDGVPTKGKLLELGLDWLVNDHGEGNHISG